MSSLSLTDVNECSTDPCSALAICLNLPGSFTCYCPQGYQFQNSSDVTSACLDIDECLDESLNECDINAACVNSAGGYTCICIEEDHYQGDGYNCICELIFERKKSNTMVVIVFFSHCKVWLVTF